MFDDEFAAVTMRRVWDTYILDNAYAKGATFDKAVDSIESIIRSIGLLGTATNCPTRTELHHTLISIEHSAFFGKSLHMGKCSIARHTGAMLR